MRLPGSIVLGLALASLATCGSMSVPVESPSVPVELGVREFTGADDIAIHAVTSSDGELRPGSLVKVQGSYSLDSRQGATLYLGTTMTVDARTEADPAERTVVERGTGRFELTHRIPAEGFLHVTYYDLGSGRPFGGVYFGRGEGVLRSKHWSYGD